ncbi:CinA family nicotinamide mononucleotide deamidase-related protein [Staphylococcus sp. NRL 16/872]|uniref:CinA family nicotinamide mononucleotide deamidase-related protein n=1 Tax=Staphylococcus sp. NRL 16/872 TaxID=2930131 RepID=UPI001FB2A22E|nr:MULTISPECIES: CinA family nicotinamide mononucleotide deamidase-related protein [unclassified Staphylococcus]MCJ1656480.1 CinA family nicotinamide mononucleotide deamidase-related protein [Staphylococcus sp. NRL 21/187]MCJ1662242.1 CinA family nicotinamide mononucleotide deamidase-related protein [Staphylococcus sp. NRL 18/288]MCJ1668317.1 CinA family nicotinamide mononucleotide deamidase-related protein [Staphylococcus sp. NRL 19/737]WEN68516.1 CinA family nicotinamide mononucleotide deamid
MNISIIAVGSELLLGQIANTNGQYLSKLFNSIGKSVVEHTVIGDNPQRLEYIIKEGLRRFDTLVLTGGLGPTKDDLTKHTVAKVLGKSLVTDNDALEYIEQYFKEQGQEMTPNNKQQALVIEGSKVLKNNYGMAPGMLVEKDDKKVVLLPGPPREMQPMAKNELLPYLMDDDKVIFSEQLRFAGIGESKVETVLMDLIDEQSNPTIAPLAGTHEVYIRLTANADTKDECQQLIAPVKKEILNRIGEYYYGSDDIVIEQSVMKTMTETFSIYDGVTNGAIYTRLKNYDNKNILKGLLPDNEVFLNENNNIEEKVKEATQYVKDLYKTEVGIALLHENEYVVLGMHRNGDFKIDTFKMPQKRNLLQNRSQNYALIRILNWFS